MILDINGKGKWMISEGPNIINYAVARNTFIEIETYSIKSYKM